MLSFYFSDVTIFCKIIRNCHLELNDFLSNPKAKLFPSISFFFIKIQERVIFVKNGCARLLLSLNSLNLFWNLAFIYNFIGVSVLSDIVLKIFEMKNTFISSLR